MSKSYEAHLKNMAEIAKQQKLVSDNAQNMSDMSVISTQLLMHVALLADISESLAIIADKMGGAE